MFQTSSEPLPHLALRASLNNILLEIWQGDILSIPADSLINAANEHLEHIGGLALHISQQAGPELAQASKDWIRNNGQIKPGKVAVTRGFNLNYKYIIHAVGPKEKDSPSNREMLIGTLFQSFLESNKLGCQSTVIPALSTGIFMFPKDVSALLHIQAFIMYAGLYIKTVNNYSLTKIAFGLNSQEVIDLFVSNVIEKESCFQYIDYIGTHKDFNGSLERPLCELCKMNYSHTFFAVYRCCAKICDFCFYQNPNNVCLSCKTPVQQLPQNYPDPSSSRTCRRCFNFYQRGTQHRC